MNSLPQFIKTVLFEDGPSSLPVTGSSMLPLVKHNDPVIISPFKPGHPKNGHCYVFLHNYRLVIHRLLFHNSHWAYFTGDNSHSVEKIAPCFILGIAHVPVACPFQWLVTAANLLFFPLRYSVIFKIRSKIVRSILRLGGRNERV